MRLGVTTKSVVLALVGAGFIASMAGICSAEVAGTKTRVSAADADSSAADIKALVEKAEQGDAKALYKLGFVYPSYNTTDANGVSKCSLAELERARIDAKSAAAGIKALCEKTEQGDPNAQYNLGFVYAYDPDVAENYRVAMKWWTKAAEQGHAMAQFNLGDMYYNGWGVKLDYKEAANWLTKAAKQGLAEAQGKLGIMYNCEQGVERNDKEAMKWYTKAAAQGNALAQYNLGLMYEERYGVVKEDYVTAYKWMILSAALGNDLAVDEKDSMRTGLSSSQIAEAQKLAREFRPVVSGVAMPDEIIVAKRGKDSGDTKLLREKAEKGDAASQFNLGLMYANGQGVDKDHREAAKWWVKAAEQGYAEAQYNVGLRYWLGLGVMEDYVEASKWMILASAQGEEHAVAKRDAMRKELMPSQLAEAERLAREFKPKRSSAGKIKVSGTFILGK